MTIGRPRGLPANNVQRRAKKLMMAELGVTGKGLRRLAKKARRANKAETLVSKNRYDKDGLVDVQDCQR